MTTKTAEELDQEADELWKVYFAPEADGEPVEPADSAKPEPETQEPAETQATSGQEAPPVEDSAAGDELDGLSLQNAEERIKNAQARMHTATQEAGQLRKEVGQLRAENQRLSVDVDMLKRELEQARKAPKPPPESADSAAGIDDGDLKSAMEEWPEVVTPLLKRNQQLESRLRALEGTVSETVQASRATQEQAVLEAHNQRILAAHPDAFEVAGTDDFQGWLSRQVQVVQTAVQQGTADDVVWVLDQYKAAIGKSNRLQQAREAVTPSARGERRQPVSTGPKFTRAQIDAMSDEEFARHEAEIDRALAEGLIR